MKKMALMTALLAGAFSLAACSQTANSTSNAASSTPIKTETAASAASAAASAVAKKAEGVWIDVRSADEFKQGHLEGAVNVTHEQIASEIAKISPDKNAPVNLYCRSGRRAEAALQELKKSGYTNVTNHGGYEDLLKQGLR